MGNRVDGWSADEVAILRQHYADADEQKICALLPQRSANSIRAKARWLGLQKVSTRLWTPAEDATLRAHAATASQDEMYVLLPGRSYQSITIRARKLGLLKKDWRPFWTDAEITILREHYAIASRAQLQALLPGRTEQGVQLKAKDLGLSKAPRTPALRRYFHQYRRNAQARDYAWHLDYDLFKSLTAMRCYWCGVPPRHRIHKIGRFEYPLTANGIDRRDNDVGYTPENVTSCCDTCNYAKRNMSPADFEAYLDRVSLYRIRCLNCNEGHDKHYGPTGRCLADPTKTFCHSIWLENETKALKEIA